MRHSVPEELEAVIRRAMEKTAADRFQSMDEFKRAVLGEIPAQTATQSKYTARYRVQGAVKHGNRRRPMMIAAAVAVPVLIAGAFAAKALTTDKGAAPDADKVAVLYFTDETGGALEHVADGLTESLIERLDDVSAISVVPANGVRFPRPRATAAACGPR